MLPILICIPQCLGVSPIASNSQTTKPSLGRQDVPVASFTSLRSSRVENEVTEEVKILPKCPKLVDHKDDPFAWFD